MMLVFVKFLVTLLSTSSLFHHAMGEELKPFRIGLVPKYDSEFFRVCLAGCEYQAAKMTETTGRNVTCLYLPPVTQSVSNEKNEGEVQAEYLFELVKEDMVDAIALAALEHEIVTPVINKAAKLLPIVTFDADAPKSDRLAYVGTENYAFGHQLARLAQQIAPEGGTYVVAYKSESLNLLERVIGIDAEMAKDGRWKPLESGHVDVTDTPDDLLAKLYPLAQLDEPPTVVITTSYGYMNEMDWASFVDATRFANMKFVAADASVKQQEFLASGYAHALLGQIPYDFGRVSVEVLYDALSGKKLEHDAYGTDFISHMLVPMSGSAALFDVQTLGKLSYTGFVVFGVTVLAVSTALWKAVRREDRERDPLLSISIAAGTVLIAAAVLPLSFDDDGQPDELSDTSSKLICMSSPWLAFTGFSIILAAFYSHVSATSSDGRAKLLSMSAFKKPFLSLVTTNVILLVLWTILDPLHFIREEEGDAVTNGQCKPSGDGYLAYFIPLLAINGLVLVYTLILVFKNRTIIPESTSLGSVALWHAFAILVPLCYAVRDDPRVLYMTYTIGTFFFCMSIVFVSYFMTTSKARSTRKNDAEEST